MAAIVDPVDQSVARPLRDAPASVSPGEAETISIGGPVRHPDRADTGSAWILFVVDGGLGESDLAELFSPLASHRSARPAVLYLKCPADRSPASTQATHHLRLVAQALDELPNGHRGPVRFLARDGHAANAVQDAAAQMDCRAVVISRRSPIADAVIRRLLSETRSGRSPAVPHPAVLVL